MRIENLHKKAEEVRSQFNTNNPPATFEEREKTILQRIQRHYSLKLGREISYKESQDIAKNLLNFAHAIYGVNT